MAKKPKKAAPETEGGEASAGKSKKKLIMIGGAAALVVAGGAGFFLMGGHGEAHGEGQAAAKASGGHGGGGHGGGGHGDTAAATQAAVFLDVKDMIVNLSPEPGQAKGGFLKLKVALELKGTKTEEEVKPLLPRVEDALQTYMRELRASDLSGSAGLYRLREELLRRVNVAVHPAKAEAVLFKDVIVQ